ncbi:MAG: hypothetical protein IT379_00160 [Deltaproteobacteria bacterium]|nr:hypothetical protein [Deltaproteobacteria bacterium]
MDRWPTVDPALRRRLFAAMRARHTRGRAATSATERFRRADEMTRLAAERTLPRASRSDEPPELWLRLKARWRAVPAPA